MFSKATAKLRGRSAQHGAGDAKSTSRDTRNPIDACGWVCHVASGPAGQGLRGSIRLVSLSDAKPVRNEHMSLVSAPYFEPHPHNGAVLPCTCRYSRPSWLHEPSVVAETCYS